MPPRRGRPSRPTSPSLRPPTARSSAAPTSLRRRTRTCHQGRSRTALLAPAAWRLACEGAADSAKLEGDAARRTAALIGEDGTLIKFYDPAGKEESSAPKVLDDLGEAPSAEGPAAHTAFAAAPQTRSSCARGRRDSIAVSKIFDTSARLLDTLTGSAPARRARRRARHPRLQRLDARARGAPRPSAGAGGGCCRLLELIRRRPRAQLARELGDATSCRRRVAARSERSVSTARSRSCSALGRRCSAVATACSMMRRCSWSAVWVIAN